jgi:hypothetical protein
MAGMGAATLHTLAGMVPGATSGADIAAVAFSLVDMVAVSGTADGGLRRWSVLEMVRRLRRVRVGLRLIPDPQLLPAGISFSTDVSAGNLLRCMPSAQKWPFHFEAPDGS